MIHFSSSSIFLLFVVFFMCEGEGNAQANPLNTAALSGEAVALKCKRPSMNVEWWLANVGGTILVMIVGDCQVLPEFTSQYTVDTTDGACNLVLLNAQLNNAGTYICQETSTPDARTSAELIILNGVQQCLPSPNPVVYGQNVTLTCDLSYKGNWPPTIRWLDRYGEAVTNDTTVTTSSNVNSHIQIPAFFPSVSSFTSVSYFNDLLLPNSTEVVRANNTPSNLYVVPTQVVDVVCPSGFFKTTQNRCYSWLSNRTTGDVARDMCLQVYPGAYLIVISDASEQTDVENYLSVLGPTWHLWTSGYSTAGCYNHTWQPIPGYSLPMTYKKFMAGQPSCSDGWQPCVMIDIGLSYEWNDFNCASEMHPFCEFELTIK